MRGLLFLFFFTSFLVAAPVEKATRYYELLLKNADNETLMERFLNAWLDEQDREGLEEWLSNEAESGGVAERRVWAKYLDRIGAQERALAQYESVLKLEPDDGKTQLAVAKLQAAGFDFEGALKTLGKRDDLEALTLRGSYEHRLGNTKVALGLWRGLLENKPKDRELREDLVSLFRVEGLGKEARELQKELIAMGRDPFQRALDQLDLGDLQLEAGLNDEAQASYQMVLAASGDGSWMEREALHKLHEIFRRERDADGLRAFLAKLREEMPHRLALQKSFARQLVITGEEDEGVAAFREVLRRTPGDESLRMEFVELLAFAERYREAAEELEALIARGATAERLLRLAELRKKFEEEKVPLTLGEIEKLKNGDAAGLLEMARIYIRFDLDEEALRVLKIGRGAHADSREISESLAELLVKLKREDEALSVWQAMAKKGGVEEALRVAQSQRRHGLDKEAFALLSGHRQELEEGFGGLRMYCELALELEKIEAAWAGVRQLATQSDAFSDLQVAVNLGSVIGRQLGLEKAIADLEGEDGNVLCLLASLQQQAERLPEADATLARAEGELARRHQIVLLTQRGDYAGAVVQLRKMIGDRVSLVQRKQLLDLLERQGDFAGALSEVEQWKIASPKEMQAWRKRATLLARLGRQAEAADELRRARNLFGRDDVGLTRELAKMQLPLGRHREALRLYEHLFRTAKTDEARLGFIDEMYAAAEQAELQWEMIARFEREHDQAKRELFPLRILAQLYKHSRNYGAHQEVLLKLYRLLPDDEKVLFELVALAEQNNDHAGARQLLQDHAARTRSAGLLQRLAAMQIKAGEIDAGLKILNGIAPEDVKAVDVESTVLSLWQLGEHQLVLKFLEDNEKLVSVDWRLRSLQADFFVLVDRDDEARDIWVELLGVESALGRTMPSNQRGALSPTGGKMNEKFWWYYLDGDPFVDVFVLRGSAIGNDLPINANEARWRSLIRLARDSMRADPSGESWLVFLKTLNHPWLAEVSGWGLFRKTEAVEVVAKEPEMRLRSLLREPKSSREDFLNLALEVEEEKPELAKTCRMHAAFKLPEGEEKIAALREHVVRISNEKEIENGFRDVQAFVRLVGPQLSFSILPSEGEGQPSSEQKEKLRLLQPWWENWVEADLEGDPGTVKWGSVIYPLAVQQLAGDIEGLFKNLDRLLKKKQLVYPVVSRGGRGASRYARPLQGLPSSDSIMNHFASRHSLYTHIHYARSAKRISPKLLEKVQALGWKSTGNEKIEEFAEQIPHVNDALLRALLYRKIGLNDEFLTEIDSLAENGKLEEKLDALTLRHVTSRRGENEVLVKALLAMDRTGLSPAEQTLLDKVTLGEAQKNRQLQNMDSKIKTDLIKILERSTKGVAGQSTASALRGLYQPLGLKAPTQKRQTSGRQSHQRKSYLQLLSRKGRESLQKRESQQERTERSFLSQLQKSFSNAGGVGYLRKLVREDSNLGLKEKALAIYHPGVSLGYLKRLRYAQLCLAYDEREKAQETLIRLREERPYDSKLDVLMLLAQQPDERAVKLDEFCRAGDINRVITSLVALIPETEGEEEFFDIYERLVVLMKDRADEFNTQDSSGILQAFQKFQRSSKLFENRSLRSMNSRLPKVKAGENSKEGDWALRTQQRKIILDAYGEMMRLRSIRGKVLEHLNRSMEALRLDRGNVEWMVFELLEKEPVKELDSKRVDTNRVVGYTIDPFASGPQGGSEGLALRAVLDSQKFSSDSVDALVRHLFLSEKEGDLVKAALEGDALKVETLLTENFKKKVVEATVHPHPISQGGWPVAPPSLPAWASLLEALLRSERWEDSVREKLEKGIADSKSEQEFLRLELMRVCELGSLEDSFAALEAMAAAYFPCAEVPESYQELVDGGVVPREIKAKIGTGQRFFGSCRTLLALGFHC